MKKYAFLVVLAMVILSSCSKKDDVKVSHSPVFAVTATDVGPNYAQIEIRHDGSNRDTYYGFIVDGIVDNLSLRVDSFIKRNKYYYKNGYTLKKRVFTLTSLLPDHQYTYVVFGYKDDGWTVCNINSCCFMTTHGIDSFVVNDNYKIDILGEVKYKNEYWTKVDYTFGDDNRDYIYGCLATSKEYKNSKDIATLIYMKASAISEFLIMYDEYSLADITTVSCVSYYAYYWRESGDYYALAIAVDEKGQPTGQYAISEKFHIDDYTHLEGFDQLLGKWKIKDADGKTFTVTFENEKTNRSYKVKKWGGLSLSIDVTYDANDKCGYIKYQKVASDVEFKDSNVGDIYLNEWYSKTEGRFTFCDGIETLAVINASSNTSAKISRMFNAGSGYNHGLLYQIFYESGDNNAYLTDSDFKFPLQMTKVE